MPSMVGQDSDSNTPDLPAWVISLVRAIEESEDTHPTYWAEFALSGWSKLAQCPESRFLALVPDEVRKRLATELSARSSADTETLRARIEKLADELDGGPDCDSVVDACTCDIADLIRAAIGGSR